MGLSLIKILVLTRTNPATKTKSIGLLTFAFGYSEQSRSRCCWNHFAETSGELNRGMTTIVHLSGLGTIKSIYHCLKLISFTYSLIYYYFSPWNL